MCFNLADVYVDDFDTKASTETTAGTGTAVQNGTPRSSRELKSRVSSHLAVEAEGEVREVAGERVRPGAAQRRHAAILGGAVVEQRLAAMHNEVAHGRPLADHPHEVAQLLVRVGVVHACRRARIVWVDPKLLSHPAGVWTQPKHNGYIVYVTRQAEHPFQKTVSLQIISQLTLPMGLHLQRKDEYSARNWEMEEWLAAPSLHLTVMGTLVAAAIAAQQAATSSGSSIRLAPKQPAPATFSLREKVEASAARDITPLLSIRNFRNLGDATGVHLEQDPSQMPGYLHQLGLQEHFARSQCWMAVDHDSDRPGAAAVEVDLVVAVLRDDGCGGRQVRGVGPAQLAHDRVLLRREPEEAVPVGVVDQGLVLRYSHRAGFWRADCWPLCCPLRFITNRQSGAMSSSVASLQLTTTISVYSQVCLLSRRASCRK